MTRFLGSRLSICLQRVAKQFQELFRFTEADALTILSAYGFNAFEIDRLQRDRAPQASDKLKTGRFDELKAAASNGKDSRWLPLAAAEWPIPIGIHPDFSSGTWRRISSKQIVSRKS